MGLQSGALLVEFAAIPTDVLADRTALDHLLAD